MTRRDDLADLATIALVAAADTAGHLGHLGRRLRNHLRARRPATSTSSRPALTLVTDRRK